MSEKNSFWKTVPGILTGVAAIITALGGLVLTVHKTGFLESKKDDEIVITRPDSQQEEKPPAIGSTTEIEPNGKFTTATPILPDTEIQAYLSSAVEKDFYTFETGNNYKNVFDIKLINKGSFAPDIFIYDSLKNRLDNRYSSTPGADLIVHLSAQPESKYYLVVTDMDGFTGRTGDYVLILESK